MFNISIANSTAETLPHNIPAIRLDGSAANPMAPS